MRECPNCSRVYSDDSLRFCLDDGSRLITSAAPQPTLRIESPVKTALATEVLPASKTSVSQQRSVVPWVIAGVAILVAAIVLVASLGVLIFQRRPSKVAGSPIQSRTPGATPTSGPDILNLAGTRWHDTTSVSMSTKSYYFNPNGTINGNASDTWHQDGRKVTLDFTNGYAHYDGTLNGEQIDYKATNKADFSWSATLILDK